MELTTRELCVKYDGVIHDKYPGHVITKRGEIYSISRERFLDKTLRKRDPQNIDSKYDEMVHLVVENSPKTVAVHRLLATAFIPNPLDKDTVNHIDGNPSNNKLDNLEWMTQSENSTHAHALGLVAGSYTRCSVSKIHYKEEFVASYSSITQAATTLCKDKNAVGLIGITVSNNSKGHTTALGTPYSSNGYVWRYLDKEKKEYYKKDITFPINTLEEIPHKSIEGYTDYVITIDGRVYDKVKQKWLTTTVIDTNDGRIPYAACSLRQGKKHMMFRVAKLVAKTFGKHIGKIDFVDGNICNCHLDNLCEKERGTNSRPVAAYRLLWKDVDIQYVDSTKEVEQVTGMRTQAVLEAISLNKGLPIANGYTNNQRPYTRSNYVIRGLSKN